MNGEMISYAFVARLPPLFPDQRDIVEIWANRSLQTWAWNNDLLCGTVSAPVSLHDMQNRIVHLFNHNGITKPHYQRGWLWTVTSGELYELAPSLAPVPPPEEGEEEIISELLGNITKKVHAIRDLKELTKQRPDIQESLDHRAYLIDFVKNATSSESTNVKKLKRDIQRVLQDIPPLPQLTLRPLDVYCSQKYGLPNVSEQERNIVINALPHMNKLKA
jgi:hypothetical protein